MLGFFFLPLASFIHSKLQKREQNLPQGFFSLSYFIKSDLVGYLGPPTSDRPNIWFGRTSTVRFSPNDNLFLQNTELFFFTIHCIFQNSSWPALSCLFFYVRRGNTISVLFSICWSHINIIKTGDCLMIQLFNRPLQSAIR